jgi:hypothetical protein
MLLFAFIGDLLQYAVRIIVSVLNQPNLSTHLVTLSMLINRFGAALGLLMIGFMIDTGITASKLSVIYGVFAIILAAFYWMTARYWALGPRFLTPFIVRYYRVAVNLPELKVDQVSCTKLSYDIAIIFSVALIGFLLPSILAAGFPDYRATLLQTGFILNSLATLYSALKIEKGLALTLHNGTNAEKWQAYCNFMQARAVGSILAAALWLAIFLVI